MYRKSFFASCSLLLCAMTAAGQSLGQPAAQPGKTSTLIEQRMQFVRDAYELDDQQKQRLRADLVKLQGIHEAYLSKYARTLRRQAKAISLVIPQQSEYDQTMRASLIAKIQNEIYNINAGAPLSLANVVSKTEAMLSRARIEGGRRKIAAKYATLLKGKSLNIKTIDRLILKPVRPSTTPAVQTFATPAPSARKKADPAQRRKVAPKPIKIERQASAGQAQPPATASRATPPIKAKTPPSKRAKTPPARRAKAPARPMRPLPPAPPTTGWAAALDASVTKYGFSEKQKLIAQKALKSCLHRAEAYLQQNKESLDLAKQAAPSDENTKRLVELQRPIDKLYDELNQRVDSLATVEQTLAANKKKAQESSAKK